MLVGALVCCGLIAFYLRFLGRFSVVLPCLDKLLGFGRYVANLGVFRLCGVCAFLV